MTGPNQSAEITPAMVGQGREILARWLDRNSDALELGGLGDVYALLAAIIPILPNSCKSSSDTDRRD